MNDGIDRYFKDGHGHEILGLKEAKTKEEKIAAVQKHLDMLEGLHSEIYNAVEQKLVDIKTDKQAILMSKYADKIPDKNYITSKITDNPTIIKELTEEEFRSGQQGFVYMDAAGKLIFKK